MARTVLRAASLGCLVILATASEAQNEKRTSAGDRAEILSRSNEWMTAMDQQDRGTLERLTGNNYQLHLLYGDEVDITSRQQWIDGAVKRRWRHNGYDDVNIVTRGDYAVMASKLNFAPPANGLLKPAVSTSGAVVDIWERQGGHWRVVGRYAGRWTFFAWIDRLLGFVVGALVFGLIGWMLGRRKRRRTA